jgi:hypothetical protein
MSTSNQQQPSTEPTLHTIVLYLRPDESSSADPHVDIRGEWWHGVKPGDLVRFVPDHDSIAQFVSDEKLRGTATVEVQFRSEDGKPFSGTLGVPEVTTSDPHQVKDHTSPFVAWCFLHVGDKRYGYEGTDGRPCPQGCG